MSPKRIVSGESADQQAGRKEAVMSPKRIVSVEEVGGWLLVPGSW